MSTDVPVHRYTCSLYFFFFGITCTITFQLICWGTYTQINPEINLPIYFHASFLFNHKDLPVTWTTSIFAHRCTCSWPNLLIFILLFQLTIKIYLSTFPLFYMSTDIPVHHYTCSVYFFFFSITCRMTFQLIYRGTNTQIHPKINLPVYLHRSCFSFVWPQRPTCHHNYLCTYPYLYLFMILPVHVHTSIPINR